MRRRMDITVRTSLMVVMILLLSSCKVGEDRAYRITETYRITSAAGTMTYLAVDLPVSYGYQSVGAITVENATSHSFEQKDDYQQVHVELEGDGTERTVTVSYPVTLFFGTHNWAGDLAEGYLSPEQFIDSDNPRIVALAGELAVAGNEYGTAENISKFVSGTLEFDPSPKINQPTLAASEVLDIQHGVCGDYANLMTALLRASGIPARRISGLVLDDLGESAEWSSPAGSHAWVEFYVNGQWHFDDPTWGDGNFDHSDAYHLSYGSLPVALDSELRREMIRDIEDRGLAVIGAMTAPIKFAAWSEDEAARIIPQVEIIRQ